MKHTAETIVADAMRELAETHRAYKAFLAADADDTKSPLIEGLQERKHQHLYDRYCTARDRVVALAEQMFPSGATRRRPA